MGEEGGGGEGTTLEYTPTWVLQKNNQKPLFEALQKVKEELMLLGFISLLLTVFQSIIARICIPEKYVTRMLPCSLGEDEGSSGSSKFHNTSTVRRVLSEISMTQVAYCAAQIRQWKHWEDSFAKDNYDTEQALKPKITNVHQHDFIRGHFISGSGENIVIVGWASSFFKQFYASVTKADYLTLRYGFIMTHCKGNTKFNFHKYMIRALEDDFKRIVGISWYLWLFAIVFLLLNVNGWHMYFWMAFIPFFLLLAVGTKLEHVIFQLGIEVAEKHVAIEGDLVVRPSDNHFWFNRPRIVLFLIHFIQFQNSFEIAFFFWIWVQYGFKSCIMGELRYIIPRLIVGIIIQVLSSYSTLPLYALVTQMGSNFKKAIFDEHVQAGLIGWAQKAKKRRSWKQTNTLPRKSALKEAPTPSTQLPGREAKEPPNSKDEIQLTST
ncbi:MLO-like protein [Drosera capensis]